MKIKKGFISNSSTTSFIIVGIQPSEKELKRITEKDFEKFKKEYLEDCVEGPDPVDDSDIWDDFLCEYEGPKGLELHKCEGSDDILIGEITAVDYSETFDVDYFAKTAVKVAKALGIDESKIKVFVEYSGQM